MYQSIYFSLSVHYARICSQNATASDPPPLKIQNRQAPGMKIIEAVQGGACSACSRFQSGHLVQDSDMQDIANSIAGVLETLHDLVSDVPGLEEVVEILQRALDQMFQVLINYDFLSRCQTIQ